MENQFSEFSIEVITEQASGLRKLPVKKGESLMDTLIRAGIYISAFCGGNGRCGKCKVQVLEGDAPISSEDRNFFTEEELKSGWRLSCTLHPTSNLKIAPERNDESQFDVVSEYNCAVGDKQKATGLNNQEYDIAIDIGTTTLAFELIHKSTGEVLHAVTSVNGQRKYGADVVARIQTSVEGRKKELQESIQKDVVSGIQRLVQECNITIDKIKQIGIAGNTTMIHLLKGYDCKSLGVFPFEPVNIDMICEPASKTLGNNSVDIGALQAENVILPGISTYVGGDIVSGLYAYGFAGKDDICLLIDLGTNGEMALGNRERILVTSTAAGPAFEGGNISRGMGSVAGAICSVMIDGNEVKYKTICDEVPCGICGTGVLETVAELVKAGLVDETGLLEDTYFDNGFPLAKDQNGKDITFTQKDIREIQLAKAAIRAGIETLLLRYGITTEQVTKVYLAGGFGYRLDTNKAVYVGMLPEALLDRIEAVGNSSLAGVVKYLKNRNDDDLRRIISVSSEITLANDADFNEFYMNAMMFADEKE